MPLAPPGGVAARAAQPCACRRRSEWHRRRWCLRLACTLAGEARQVVSRPASPELWCAWQDTMPSLHPKTYSLAHPPSKTCMLICLVCPLPATVLHVPFRLFCCPHLVACSCASASPFAPYTLMMPLLHSMASPAASLMLAVTPQPYWPGYFASYQRQVPQPAGCFHCCWPFWQPAQQTRQELESARASAAAAAPPASAPGHRCQPPALLQLLLLLRLLLHSLLLLLLCLPLLLPLPRPLPL